MNSAAPIALIIDALALPAGARVDARVPKKLLIEQGAPTSADKRSIQDGIDELQWFAACKPANIGVPAFVDAVRDYAEIAVVGCAFRPGAKASRLIELVHRAIPYPALLVTADTSRVMLSAAHKRKAQNELDRIVIEQVVATKGLGLEAGDAVQSAFLDSLALARQDRADLHTLYSSWLASIEAYNAAAVTGAYVATSDKDAIARRRTALEEHELLTKEVNALRARAKHEKQLNRRVELNLAIQRLESNIGALRKDILGEV
jgi:hypothetical protein